MSLDHIDVVGQQRIGRAHDFFEILGLLLIVNPSDRLYLVQKCVFQLFCLFRYRKIWLAIFRSSRSSAVSEIQVEHLSDNFLIFLFDRHSRLLECLREILGYTGELEVLVAVQLLLHVQKRVYQRVDTATQLYTVRHLKNLV